MLKTSPSEQKTHQPENSFTEKDINDARKLVNLLLLAWKNYSLYPQGHVAAIKALENLKTSFEDFFSSHSILRLKVEKNRLLCDGSVLHEVSPDSSAEDLVYLLYRDGVQWLEFIPGLPLDELVYFFTVLHKFRMLVEETEGDIVTDLTDGNLEHINFKAVDIFWENLPLIDFSDINPTEPETEESAPHIEVDLTKGLKRGEIQARSIADPSISEVLWEISPSEQQQLQKMVQEEENWDNTQDVLDVLIVILRSQTDKYSFSSVLDFSLEEVVDAIQQGEFGLLHNLFQSLYQMGNREASPDLDWRQPMIERFFHEISQPEIFAHITDKLMMLDEEETEKIQNLREVLLYFSPAIILSLGPILLQTRITQVQKMILDVIGYLSLKDMSPLETLLDHPDQKMAEALLPLLSRMRGKNSSRIFFKMSQHASDKVRAEAVRILLSRDSQSVFKLFPLINDQSIKIRRYILAGIAKQKSAVLENMLLKYIKENTDNNPEYIHSCYEALGRCGSEKSIPYLRRVLLARGWNRFIGLGKPVHREGAAAALSLLNNRQATDILQKGSKSRFRVIREAVHQAMARSEPSGDVTNG